MQYSVVKADELDGILDDLPEDDDFITHPNDVHSPFRSKPARSSSVAKRVWAGHESHYIFFWSTTRLPTDVSEKGVEIHLSNQLLQQILSVDMLNLILNRIRGYMIPTQDVPILLPGDADVAVSRQLNKQFGKALMKINNFRIHRAIITGMKGIDKRTGILEHVCGSVFVDMKAKSLSRNLPHIFAEYVGQSPINDDIFRCHSYPSVPNRPLTRKQRQAILKHAVTTTAQDQTIITVRENYVSLEIKGLSFDITSDYTIEGIEGAMNRYMEAAGTLFMRAVDASLLLDMELTYDEDTRKPTIRVFPTPQIRWGKLRIRFGKTAHDQVYTAIANMFTRYLKSSLVDMVADLLMSHLPMLTDIVGDLIDDAIRINLNDQFTSMGLAATKVPELIIQDMAWEVKNYKIVLGFNIQYVDPDYRMALQKELAHLEVQEALVSSEERQRHIADLYERLRSWGPEMEETQDSGPSRRPGEDREYVPASHSPRNNNPLKIFHQLRASRSRLLPE